MRVRHLGALCHRDGLDADASPRSQARYPVSWRLRLPEVDIDLCTACGDCVDICPRDLFSPWCGSCW